MLELEKQRQADPWGLLASQPHLLSEFQDSEALSKEEAASARDNSQVLLQHPHTHSSTHKMSPDKARAQDGLTHKSNILVFLFF